MANTNEILKAVEQPFETIDVKSVVLNAFGDIEDNDVFLRTYARLRKITKGIEEAIKEKEIKQTAASIVDKRMNIHAVKKIKVEGVELTYAATKTTYDYSVSEHPVLMLVNTLIGKLTDIKKSIEKELKTIPDMTPVIDEETGEVTNVGGTRDIILDPNMIQAQFTFLIKDVQELLDLIAERNGKFTVKQPVKEQTFGVKAVIK